MTSVPHSAGADVFSMQRKIALALIAMHSFTLDASQCRILSLYIHPVYYMFYFLWTYTEVTSQIIAVMLITT